MSEQFLGSDVIHTQETLTVTLEPDPLDCWVEENTASALIALAVRLHGSGLSLRETAAALETFGVHRSHQAVFQWVHRVAQEASDPPTAKPSRVAVDETPEIGIERHWLYGAIDVETKLVLDVWLSPRRGTDPAAEKHDLSEATFLVDRMGYLTALARCNLRGHLDYVERNLIEKWVQTLTMRIDRFHQTWVGGEPVPSAGSPPSPTTITGNDQIRHSMTALPPRK